MVDALQDLDAAVEAFCAYIESLPPEALAPREWGPKEVLAHLAFYHALYVEQACAIIEKRSITQPVGPYYEVNRRIAAESRDVPAAELLQRLRAANRQLLALARSCDPASITLPLYRGVRPRALDNLLPAVAGHFRGHLRQLMPKRRIKTA